MNGIKFKEISETKDVELICHSLNEANFDISLFNADGRSAHVILRKLVAANKSPEINQLFKNGLDIGRFGEAVLTNAFHYNNIKLAECFLSEQDCPTLNVLFLKRNYVNAREYLASAIVHKSNICLDFILSNIPALFREALSHAIVEGDTDIFEYVYRKRYLSINEITELFTQCAKEGALEVLLHLHSISRYVEFLKNPLDESFVVAAEHGQITVLEGLLSKGVSIDCSICLAGEVGRMATALTSAVNSNHSECVQFLISKEASLNKFNPIMEALDKGYLHIAEYLLKNGEPSEKTLKECWDFAIYSNDMKQVELLDDNSSLRRGTYAQILEASFKCGTNTISTILIPKVKVEPSCSESLYYACINNCLPSVEMLLQQGAKVLDSGVDACAITGAIDGENHSLLPLLLEHVSNEEIMQIQYYIHRTFPERAVYLDEFIQAKYLQQELEQNVSKLDENKKIKQYEHDAVNSL
ncbi:MAG: ankyrin repeat domain-containing protein [Endozoicomonadaceae bacterium]|nr:ankyrin repeat domain-containing protein [Endozoicomonadaceae bacterium]